jgi:DNA polymerase III subunit beta
MKFRIRKDAFLEGLQQVQGVVGSRAALPILSNVLIEATAGQLKLSTTDLDLAVNSVVECDVSDEGTTTLPVRRLASIVKELPADEISISVKDHTATLICGNSKFKLLGRNPEEFPTPTDLGEIKTYTVPQKVLKDGFKKVGYAISTDEMRFVLNGVYTVFKDNQMSLVATDGRRLAMTESDIEVAETDEISIIIPTKCVNQLQSLLEVDGDVKIRVGQKQIAFELNRNLVTSKLIEGNYPNYRQVIPGPANYRVTLEREVMLKCLQRISLLAQDKSNSIKLSFSEDQVEIMANATDIGEAHESVAVKYSGPDMAVAFNPEFLIAPFRNLDVDELYLDLIDEQSPGVIKINTPFLYVLMPMRVSQ